MEDRILRRREVEHVTGLSRSTIYAAMKAERVPKPIKLGPRAVGWVETDIREWIESGRQEN